ncbi:hypothetical protein BKA70DRAFT_1419539 [Coprinopsis sp. MPI-PUGE-AT-0042]|nr:hypothetical protein BKA70DRAFT_1419539 [Coprinopsis sp. MPI-PUGE-AT-0042]
MDFRAIRRYHTIASAQNAFGATGPVFASGFVAFVSALLTNIRFGCPTTTPAYGVPASAVTTPAFGGKALLPSSVTFWAPRTASVFGAACFGAQWYNHICVCPHIRRRALDDSSICKGRAYIRIRLTGAWPVRIWQRRSPSLPKPAS